MNFTEKLETTILPVANVTGFLMVHVLSINRYVPSETLKNNKNSRLYFNFSSYDTRRRQNLNSVPTYYSILSTIGFTYIKSPLKTIYVPSIECNMTDTLGR